MQTNAALPAQRTCAHCSASYSSPRSSSRFCSDRCKKRAQRGSHKGAPTRHAPLHRWLTRRGYMAGGAISVSLCYVLAELREAERRIRAGGLAFALPSYTEATLRTALAGVSGLAA